MSVLKLTSENFEEEVKKSDKTVLVDFYADWCGPCKMMSPIIDNIAEELGDSIKVGKVDSDENMDLAEEYGIMSIPTIMIFKGGQVVKTFNGVTSKSEILEALK
ncbi:MAG: thioredoxin [Clostridia bacterium]|nr:thioredoxin [Clostridia bacterium]